MSDLNGGAAVVRAIEVGGGRAVFGIPGTHNLEIYRHLTGSTLRHVTPRHEQGAGYAADGYARVSGQAAVCLTTSGPGLTNIVTAVATAYADSVPMLVIAPGAPRGTEGADLGLLHELRDQRSVMGSVVDHAVRVDSPDEAYAEVVEAFARFTRGRPRPAYVEVPVDVLEAPWSGAPDLPSEDSPRVAPDAVLVQQAAAALVGAAGPVVLVGGGGRGAGALVERLIERLGAILVTTVNGKGVVDERHPLSVGAALRLPGAIELVGRADVVLLLGTELGDSDLWEQEIEFAGQVIRVDLDPGQLDKNVEADIGILGDASDVVARLLEACGSGAALDRGPEVEKVRGVLAPQGEADGAVWREIQEDEVRAGVSGDVIVAGDSAMVSYFGTVHHWPMGPRDRFLYPTGYATLGYGLPAAIGAKIAAPDTATVVLVGDEGLMFSVHELITAAELGLSLPVVVVTNGGYRAIRDQMVERGIPTLGVDLRNPDLQALGQAFGLQAVRVSEVSGLTKAVADALEAPAPTLIEVEVP